MISGNYTNPTRERFRKRVAEQERERITREHHYEQAEVQEIGAPFCVVGQLSYDADADLLRAAEEFGMGAAA